MGKKYSSVQDFLTKKGIEISFKRYGIDVLGSMAMGLFASLLIGTILNTIGLKLGIPFFSETIWPIAKEMTGPAKRWQLRWLLRLLIWWCFHPSL